VKRIARTELDRFAGPEEVALFWSDNRASIRRANVPIEYLRPAVPRAADLEAVVLEGAHIGELVTIQRYKKKQGKVIFRCDSEPRVWETDESNLCWVQRPKI
jgi:hypothetical protein